MEKYFVIMFAFVVLALSASGCAGPGYSYHRETIEYYGTPVYPQYYRPVYYQPYRQSAYISVGATGGSWIRGLTGQGHDRHHKVVVCQPAPRPVVIYNQPRQQQRPPQQLGSQHGQSHQRYSGPAGGQTHSGQQGRRR